MLEAAVQDADPAAAQGAQGFVVFIAGGAALVLERAGAGALGQSAEGPLVDRVVQALVAHVAGQEDLLLPEALVMGEVPA